MPLLPGQKNVGRNIATEEKAGKKRDQAIAIALSVLRRGRKGKADGGDVTGDAPPDLGPMGRNLAIAMKYAPKSTAAALARLSPAQSFPDLIAQNPHGWGRLLPDSGSITADTPPSTLENILAAAELPARAYAGQFNNATHSVAEAMGDPSLANLTNAGVQTGVALGSPVLTLGSGAAGLGIAALKDLAPYVLPGAEAKSRNKSFSASQPALMESAMAPHDDLADKVAGDPQLEILYQAYKDAQTKANASVPGVDKASSDAIRQRASDQATKIMGQIGDALATRQKSKSDLAAQNYNQQVEEAIAARDAALGKASTFEDTNVGKVYRGMGGLGPLVAGMVPGTLATFAKGPAKTWEDTILRGLSGAVTGAGASLMPVGYNMTYAPVENPEKKAMEAYAFNLPDTHPDKAKAEAAASRMPDINPVHSAALQEFNDPSAIAKRMGWGALEGATGQEVGSLLPRALGGLFKRESYGFTPSVVSRGGAGNAADLAPDLPWPRDGSSAAKGLPDLSREPIGPTSKAGELPNPSGTPSYTPPSLGQTMTGLQERMPDPARQAALNVAKQQIEKGASSPAPVPAGPSSDDLSNQASNIIKHFQDEGVILRNENGRQVARHASGKSEGGQFTTIPEPPKPSTKSSKAKGKAAKPSDDASGSGNAKGGVIRSALDIARKYARGGVVVGPLIGNTGGRDDKLPVDAPANSFVIPADVVSYWGTGNSLAGLDRMKKMFGESSRASGGTVPIMASDGEYIVSPEEVLRRGNGDMDHGNRVLEHFVLQSRRDHINTLKKMPPPSK